jgi:hypothetical protein
MVGLAVVVSSHPVGEGNVVLVAPRSSFSVGLLNYRCFCCVTHTHECVVACSECH